MIDDQLDTATEIDCLRTWRVVAESAVADLRRYAFDATPERRLVSAKAYEAVMPLIDEPAPERPTLRDQFAMAALTGLLAAGGLAPPSSAVSKAGALADAMMKERSK